MAGHHLDWVCEQRQVCKIEKLSLKAFLKDLRNDIILIGCVSTDNIQIFKCEGLSSKALQKQKFGQVHEKISQTT